MTLNDVLEHVEDDQALFDSVWRSMKAGANLLLTVPADPTLWSQHDVSFGHFRRYTAESFSKLWQGSGAEVRLYSYFNSRLFPIVKLIRMVGGGRVGENKTDLFTLPEFVNQLLARFFAGESKRLSRSLDSSTNGTVRLPYRRGVSLIVLLQKPDHGGPGG